MRSLRKRRSTRASASGSTKGAYVMQGAANLSGAICSRASMVRDNEGAHRLGSRAAEGEDPAAVGGDKAGHSRWGNNHAGPQTGWSRSPYLAR